MRGYVSEELANNFIEKPGNAVRWSSHTVQLINDSHNAANAHPDVKLRSLLVLGVNEQCLHLWFDLLCSAKNEEPIRCKYYHPWAFIRTPAWRQVAHQSYFPDVDPFTYHALRLLEHPVVEKKFVT
nr:RUN domain containing protein [Haemonchus contortus]